MRKLVSRVALTAACTIGLTAGLAGTANANHVTVVPGCWGALGTAVCDVAVEVDYSLGVPVYTYEWDAEVCTGTCEYHRLPFAWYDLNSVPEVDQVCVWSYDRWGNVTKTCA